MVAKHKLRKSVSLVAVEDDSIEKREPNLDVIPTVHETYTLPVQLKLNLPPSFLDNPILNNVDRCVKQYGFNLALR